jgi:hypothetical protein
VLSVRKLRFVLRELVPFSLKHREFLKRGEKLDTGGKSMDIHGFYYEADNGTKTVEMATRQCCVEYLVRIGWHEIHHGAGYKEQDFEHRWIDDIERRELGKASVRSEVAYAILASRLGIPTYCPKHKPEA